MSREPISATHYILRGLLLPFSEENILLSYHPGRFFNELEKISSHNRKNLQAAFSRAQKANLIEFDENALPRLTAKGRLKAAPFETRKLTDKGKLLVIFDIPEDRATIRNEFRTLLKQLHFTMVQQSVWITDIDHRKVIKEAIKEYKLDDYVQLYEAAHI